MFRAQTTDGVCCPSRTYLETRDAQNAPWALDTAAVAVGEEHVPLSWLSRCPGCPWDSSERNVSHTAASKCSSPGCFPAARLCQAGWAGNV